MRTKAEGKGSSSPSVTWVVIAVFAGIFAGLFFGESAAVVEPIGKLYILLLQVAVYPYIVCSLLHGLGSMQPSQSWRLFKAGWPYYLGLWALTFLVLWILTLALPAPRALVWSGEAGSFSMDRLLDILIPSDIVSAITNNSVPAVILFCVFYGVALQHVSGKQSLLDGLQAVKLASLKFWGAVVRMVPVAVFALFASTAGTAAVGEVTSIGYFLILFFAGALLLIVWLIPACLEALLPIRYRELVTDLRSALMIGLVTTISVAALPFIVSATRKLAEQCQVEDPELDDVIQTNISVAYPLGQLGNFFVYFFIVFCAFLFHVEIAPVEQLLLPFVSLLACFGSPTASINSALFLGDWLGIGPDSQQLYVELMILLRYPQVAASIMGFGFLSFTVVLSYYGKLRIRPARLLAGVGGTLALLAVVSVAARYGYERFIEDQPHPYWSFTIPPELRDTVESRILTPAEKASLPPRRTGSHLDGIAESGVLRVGFNPATVPFCYYNTDGQLVGYDITLAYQLAKDLGVTLELVPFDWETLPADLEARTFDIAMSGIYVTEERLIRFTPSAPYESSRLAFFSPKANGHLFRSRKQIDRNPDLRIGVPDDPVLRPWLEKLVPSHDVVLVGPYSQPPDFEKVDGAFWTLLESEAFAAEYPGLVAVAPENLAPPVLYTYLMPADATHLRHYVDYWLRIQKQSGFAQAQRAYWIDRLPRPRHEPRWSILQNVLGITL